MGLLDEMFPKKPGLQAQKEGTRNRTVKPTPTKKATEKSNRTTAEKSSTPSHTSTNNTFFDSLKRVQGALSPASKTKSTAKQDVKKTKSTLEVPTKTTDKEKVKDKDRGRTKDKEKERRPWFRSPSRTNLKREPIKSSSTSLNVGGGVQKVALDPKKRRPISAFNDTHVTLRRGQTTKGDSQHLGDNLSRASSVTNLDVEPKSGKGARPRKSSSRDRIDKIVGDGKRNDKKGITRNNNKLDSGENNSYPSVDSLSEEELLHLRRQLQEMAQEKTNLALQLGEQKGQLNILQMEIQKLKEESNVQLEHLTDENTALRNRLRDVAHSPLSDNEKQQLLFDSHRHHSSAPASIAANIIDDSNGPDTTCTTPDWDKHSSSNVSEVSVACLQDKINQMQETHYSTNEELQATLQELTDLQRQLTELQQENEKLNEEKSLMFDSLCRQTERLNDSRSEVESLKQLLYQDKDDTGQFESAVEREQKLVDLLKSAQDEREGLLVKLEQLNNELQESRTGIIEKDGQIGHLRERVRTLECTLDAKHAEHKQLDQELAQAKDQCSGKQIEINRLTDLLDNARTKINELEQDRTLSDKSELDELLDNARKEKDSLESEVAHLKEQLAISKNEIEKLREQVSILQEECKVTRNNAKTTQSDLEYKCEKLHKDKSVLNEQLQEFQEALNEIQVQSQCQLEDKRQLSAVLSETQRNLSEAERKNLALENEVEELKRLRAEENEEWEKFQDDLLTSVRVANDFKTEAQQELQRMILENKSYRDRERQLKAEIEKLKGGTLTLKSETSKDTMDLLVKRPNRNKNKDRKESGTLSSGSRSDKTSTLPLNPTVKRRENKSLKAKRMKTLSVEEELLLSYLDSYHSVIDLSVPEDFLTEEERVIKKLKLIYENDQSNVKPVAPKPKDQLAISKPLLDSVLANPKLISIIKNPKVKTIEDMASFEKEAPEIRNLIQDIDRSKRGKSENYRPEYTKRISIIGRSMSSDHVNELEETDGPLRLYRTPETYDLTKETSISITNRDSSSVVPSDSASNYNRYSDFSLVVNSNENVFEENVKYSTLERIVQSIPKDVPEEELSKEQKFAVKLLEALEERKNTLKKLAKAKNLPISKPTLESVLRNPKLKEIIHDPGIQKAERRRSDPETPPVLEKVLRQSKSYNNISFTFEDKKHSVNVVDSDFSSETFSSAEFNVETGETGPYAPLKTWGKPVEATKIARKLDLTYENDQKNRDKNFSAKAALIKAELLELSRPSTKEIKTAEIKKEGRNRPKSLEVHASTHKSSKMERSKTAPIENIPSDVKINVVHVVIEKVPSQFSSEKKKLKQSIENHEEKRNSRMEQLSNDQNRTDSLLYNDTLSGKRRPIQLDGIYTVDLLQEKIKKKTKKEPISAVGNKYYKVSNKSPEKVKSLITSKDKTFIDKSKQDYNAPIASEISQTDERDSLTYNETLTRALKRGTSIEKDLQTSLDQPDQPPSVDEAFKNITEKLQKIQKLITEDDSDQPVNLEVKDTSNSSKFEENNPKIKPCQPDVIFDAENRNIELGKKTLEILTKLDRLSDEDAVDTSVTNLPEQSPEYDYRDILKENRIGVTSTLNYRLSYKDVVQEFKKKFTDNIEENNNDPEVDDFGDKKIVEIRSRSSSIDKEMEDILENYLHTRVSQLIKETEGASSKMAQAPSYTSFDKKLNAIVQSSFDHDHIDNSNNKVLEEDKKECQEMLAANDALITEHPVLIDVDKKLNDVIECSLNHDLSDKKHSVTNLVINTENMLPEESPETNAPVISGNSLLTTSSKESANETSNKSSVSPVLSPEFQNSTLPSGGKVLDNSESEHSKLSPTEITFSDDSYFELRDGNVKNIKAFQQNGAQKIAETINTTKMFLDDQRKLSSAQIDVFKKQTDFKDEAKQNKEKSDARLEPEVRKDNVECEIKSVKHDKQDDKVVKIQIPQDEISTITPDSTALKSEDTSISYKPEEILETPNLIKKEDLKSCPTETSVSLSYKPEEILETPNLIKKEDDLKSYQPETSVSISNEPEEILETPNLIKKEDDLESYLPETSVSLSYKPEEILETPNLIKKEDDLKSYLPETSVSLSYKPEEILETPEDLKSYPTETSVSHLLLKTNLSPNESQIFTDEEIEVVRRARNQRFPRPLSEFNERDLELVQALSKNYEDELEETTEQEGNLAKEASSENNEKEEAPLVESNAKKLQDHKKEEQISVQDVIKTEESFQPHSMSHLTQNDLDLIGKLTTEYSIEGEQLEVKSNLFKEDLAQIENSGETTNVITKDILDDSGKVEEIKNEKAKDSVNTRSAKTEPLDLESLLDQMSVSRGKVIRRKAKTVLVSKTDILSEDRNFETPSQDVTDNSEKLEEEKFQNGKIDHIRGHLGPTSLTDSKMIIKKNKIEDTKKESLKNDEGLNAEERSYDKPDGKDISQAKAVNLILTNADSDSDKTIKENKVEKESTKNKELEELEEKPMSNVLKEQSTGIADLDKNKELEETIGYLKVQKESTKNKELEEHKEKPMSNVVKKQSIGTADLDKNKELEETIRYLEVQKESTKNKELEEHKEKPMSNVLKKQSTGIADLDRNKEIEETLRYHEVQKESTKNKELVEHKEKPMLTVLKKQSTGISDFDKNKQIEETLRYHKVQKESTKNKELEEHKEKPISFVLKKQSTGIADFDKNKEIEETLRYHKVQKESTKNKELEEHKEKPMWNVLKKSTGIADLNKNKELEETKDETSSRTIETELIKTKVIKISKLPVKKPDIPPKIKDFHLILSRNNNSTERRDNVRSWTLPEDTDRKNHVSKNRLSLNLSQKSDESETNKEKKVKSFAQHFERLSQDRIKFAQKKFEPTISQFRTKVPPPGDNIEKKPIPTPRLRNQGTKDAVDIDNEANVSNHEIMSGYEENFSANDKIVKQEDAQIMGALDRDREKLGTEVPGLHESHLTVDSFHLDSTDEEDAGSVGEQHLRKSGKFRTDQMPLPTDNSTLDVNYEAKTSYSVIAIAGTAEQLDLRQPPSNVTIEPSSYNLFNLDSGSLEETSKYSSKTDFEKKKRISYMNPDFLSEPSDTESFDNFHKSDRVVSSDSKPKIVDFMPLDEGTKQYFKNTNIPDYSTLEREKTYQILNSIPISFSGSKENLQRSSTSKTDSKSNFNAAKKIFQDLEAKSEPRVTLPSKKSGESFDAESLESTEVKRKVKLVSEVDEI